MTIQFKGSTYSAQVNSIYLNQDNQLKSEHPDLLYLEAIKGKDIQKLRNQIFQETDVNRKVKLSFSAQAELKIWASYKDKEFLHSFYQSMLEAYNAKIYPTEVATLKECLSEDKQLPDWLWKAVLRADQDRIAKRAPYISSSSHEEWATEVSLFYIAVALKNEELSLYLLDRGYQVQLQDLAFQSFQGLKECSESYYQNLMKDLLAHGYHWEDFLAEYESL